ncbi:hypothetical protein PAXRUDRAFT_834747, partial [Paxillus rubicundulus Ve08.2h10]
LRHCCQHTRNPTPTAVCPTRMPEAAWRAPSVPLHQHCQPPTHLESQRLRTVPFTHAHPHLMPWSGYHHTLGAVPSTLPATHPRLVTHPSGFTYPMLTPHAYPLAPPISATYPCLLPAVAMSIQ